MQRIKLRDIRVAMMIVNFIAVSFVSLFIYRTTENICEEYQAREFLNTVRAIPGNPLFTVFIAVGLYALLLLSILLRERIWVNNTTVAYGSLVFDFLVSVGIVWALNFNYNGIFFLVFTGVISYAKGDKGK